MGKRYCGRQGEGTIRDLLADERCSQVILAFLSTTDVGRLGKTHRARRQSGNLRERREREEDYIDMHRGRGGFL